MAYRTIKLDLSAPFDDKEIFPPGTTIREIAVLSVPANTTFKLRIGDNPDSITISEPFSMKPEGDRRDTDYGVHATNGVAQANTIVEVLISTGASGLGTIAQ